MTTKNANLQNKDKQNKEQEAISTTYQGFLVRMWKDGSAALWRSSAQSVQTGEIVRFANLTELFAFLEAQAGGLLEGELPDDEFRVGWRSHQARK